MTFILWWLGLTTAALLINYCLHAGNDDQD
jgi:hypothetical protein